MKISNLLLLGLLLALGFLAYFALKGEKASTRTFQPDFIAMDTAAVTDIVLYPPTNDFAELKMTRELGNWSFATDAGVKRAKKDVVNNMLKLITMIKADRIVSRKEEKWAEYKVDDKGTRVKFLDGQESLLDLVIGKITFDSGKPSQNPGVPQQQPTSYVRLKQDNTIYATPLFLEPSFNKTINSLVDTSAAVMQ